MSRLENNIIVALDGLSEQEALAIAKQLSGKVWGFKINDLLYSGILQKLARHGRVFADAKLHDIPNTVGNSVRRLSKLGARMISVHASGGRDMIRAAVRARGKSKIVAVTVLTSRHKSDDEFKVLVRSAHAAGAQGIVCSAYELPLRRPGKLFTVVPGIRPTWYRKKDDQRRTVTPAVALAAGADYLVVGRPITRTRDPLHALHRIINDVDTER